MRSWVGKVGAIFVCAGILGGCGGGSSNNKIVAVTVTPSSLTLVSGEVTQLIVSATNSAGTAVTANATFSSSNTNLVTVSPPSGTSVGGSVCAGIWDANFVVCKGTDGSGNPLVGTATITVTAGGVTRSVTVTVHLPISAIVIDPMTGCTSIAQTQQFTPHACSAVATPHDPGPPCGPAAKEITSLVGTFTWQMTDVSVGTIDGNGLVTSVAPGASGVIARIGNVSSP